MSEKKSLTIQFDPELFDQAARLFDALGLNLPTAISVFVHQAVREKKIPFEISLRENESLSPALKKLNASKDNTSKDNAPKDNASKDNTPKDNALKGNAPKDNASKDNASASVAKNGIDQMSMEEIDAVIAAAHVEKPVEKKEAANNA
ncbi:MAG: type II toxin-antitoxin system RelB/DinJ family antitoxin [Deltaproteobacteria bacterium]|jgi:DNA-damage-inducible protein J|nr:type II toxin-antitoxin system RelB/DinJ family antitoxin [Deltaproteobacteria bacterium]